MNQDMWDRSFLFLFIFFNIVGSPCHEIFVGTYNHVVPVGFLICFSRNTLGEINRTEIIWMVRHILWMVLDDTLPQCRGI